MKRAIIALMLFCALQTKAQTKANDTTKIDSVEINISVADYQRLFDDIRVQAQGKADIKPQEWEAILQILYNNTKPKTKRK